jgi:hypothetical protein
VKSVLIESKSIESGEVDIYMSSKYRVRTIIPFKQHPVMNVYLFTKEELNTFLEGYDQHAEFIVSVEQAEAMA